jgi:hypothetical protein
MFLLFLQNFGWQKFSKSIRVDAKLNFMLRLFNRASQVITLLMLTLYFINLGLVLSIFSSSESFILKYRNTGDI